MPRTTSIDASAASSLMASSVMCIDHFTPSMKLRPVAAIWIEFFRPALPLATLAKVAIASEKPSLAKPALLKGSRPEHALVADDAGMRDLDHGGGLVFVGLEREGAVGDAGKLFYQAHHGAGLDAERAGVAHEQPGKVGAVPAIERIGVLAAAPGARCARRCHRRARLRARECRPCPPGTFCDSAPPTVE